MMEVLLWFLWLCSAPVLSLVTEKKLWYESRPRTWDEARQICRSKSGELATVETSSDFDDIKAKDLRRFHAWLGLMERDSGWRWWNGYEEHPIEDLFAEGQREKGHKCGKIIRAHRKAYTDDCEQRHFFFCETRDDNNRFTFVDETKPWTEALQFCKDQSLQFMDLTGYSKFNWTGTPVYRRRDFPVWIGLHHHGSAWTWSDGTPSQTWTSGPSDGSGSCASVSSLDKAMKSYDCSEAFPFVCERLHLVLVKELLSWEHGVDVCRKISGFDSQGDFSLLSVEESDLPNIMSHTRGANTTKVWLGVRFLAGYWFWSDGAGASLPSLVSSPEARLRCGALVLNTGSIEPADCSLKLNVLCHRRRRQ